MAFKGYLDTLANDRLIFLKNVSLEKNVRTCADGDCDGLGGQGAWSECQSNPATKTRDEEQRETERVVRHNRQVPREEGRGRVPDKASVLQGPLKVAPDRQERRREGCLDSPLLSSFIVILPLPLFDLLDLTPAKGTPQPRLDLCRGAQGQLCRLLPFLGAPRVLPWRDEGGGRAALAQRPIRGHPVPDRRRP